MDEDEDYYEEDYYEEEEEYGDEFDMSGWLYEENCEDLEDAYAKMHAFNYTGLGKEGVLYSFILDHAGSPVTGVDPRTNLSKENTGFEGLVFYPRSQNCYGELRKYKSIHDDCLQPEDRPNDLFAPFPETGVPVAISVPFVSQWRVGYGSPAHGPNPGYHEFEKMVRILFSNESPWVKGFGGEEFCEFTYDQDKRIRGVVIKTADLDPTVLVNLLKNLQTCGHGEMKSAKRFNSFIAAGMTTPEACFTWVSITEGWSGQLGIADSYINPAVISFKRMATKDPHILSKGKNGTSFKDRSDYSRYFMHMPFGVFAAPKDPRTGEDLSEWYNPEEKGISLAKELATRGVYTMDVERIIPIMRELINAV